MALSGFFLPCILKKKNYFEAFSDRQSKEDPIPFFNIYFKDLINDCWSKRTQLSQFPFSCLLFRGFINDSWNRCTVFFLRAFFPGLFRGFLMNPRNKWVEINQVFLWWYIYIYIWGDNNPHFLCLVGSREMMGLGVSFRI